MTRVAVFGNAGGGKTTLCYHLGNAKQLPVYQLDLLQWNPGWVATPKVEFDRQHSALLEKREWIIDGLASLKTIQSRIEAADTIVFVDFPLPVHYWWATKRQLRCLFRERADFVEDCPMLPKTIELAKMIWRIDRELKPKILALINQQNKQTYHIRSRKEYAAFRLEHCAV